MIGHAIGLVHAGEYNGSAHFGVDNLYGNDSWQMSIMSYFDQAENTYVSWRAPLPRMSWWAATV